MLFLIPVQIQRGKVGGILWSSKERLLERIIAELQNFRNMRLRTRQKNNYERRTEEVKKIDGLLNYTMSEKRNTPFRLIDGLR